MYLDRMISAAVLPMNLAHLDGLRPQASSGRMTGRDTYDCKPATVRPAKTVSAQKQAQLNERHARRLDPTDADAFRRQQRHAQRRRDGHS